MTLNIQIHSLIFSFVFGIFFSLFINLNHKIIYNSHLIIKLIGTTLVIFSSVLAYFIMLLYINNGTFHPYELLMIVLGFYIEDIFSKRLKHQRKKHKQN